MGDRRCNDLCPEVFEYNEDELKSMVKVDEVPAQYEALVRQAADECGADAIIIEDESYPAISTITYITPGGTP